jgi:hypothetical protein
MKMTDKELITEQKETIQALHTNIHDYAAEIVRLRSKINGALALLQTGQSMHIPAAIEVLRGRE